VSSQIETGIHVPFFCFFVSIRWRDKKAVTLKSRGSGSLAYVARIIAVGADAAVREFCGPLRLFGRIQKRTASGQAAKFSIYEWRQ
jgi:hypothetical protein